jgi:hypothetical protein
MDAGLPSGSKSFAVPISKFQSDVLRLLAAQRSPDSYIAGGVAINRDGPRFSSDIDIFHDSETRLESAAKADTAALTAAADRRVPRDIVDLVTIHENILPLGAVLCAAVGKFPGVTPEEMLAEITRHSRFTAEEFQALATEQPVDVPGLHRRIRSMIEDAESFIVKLPSAAVGVIFMDGEKPVQPDVNALDKYQRNSGAPRGFWPSSPEISRAMLEHYGKLKS